MVNKISKSDLFEYTFSFTQDDVIKFAEASGDNNPIHLNDEFASRSIFKRKIIHGFLGGSVFSKVFGTIFPGEGTIYLKQDMSFFKPMFTKVAYKAIFKVIDTIPEKNRAIVKTTIFDQENQIVIDGEAIIKHPSIS